MVRLGDPESRINFKLKSNSKGPDLEAFPNATTLEFGVMP